MQASPTLPSELTIYTISDAYPLCKSWVDAPPEGLDDACLCVQAQDVAEIDAAGVQLLLSLSNTLQARQRRLRLLAPSPVLSAACAALGASDLMPQAQEKGARP